MPATTVHAAAPALHSTGESPLVIDAIDVDAAIEPYIARALRALDGRSTLLAGMLRYHLGYLEADFSRASDLTLAQSRGKRLRPAIALLVG